MTLWPDMKVGRAARLISGVGFPHQYQGRTSGAYPFLKVSDLRSGVSGYRLITSQNWVDQEDLVSLGARLAPKGAIVFPKVGAAMLKNPRRLLHLSAAMDNNLMAVVPNLGEPRFWLYALSTIDLGEIAAGGALPYVNEGQIRDLRIPFPDPEEQCRIADFLDSETARIDRMTAVTSAQQNLVEERESVAFAESVIRAGGPRLEALSLEQHVDWPMMPLNRVLRQLTNGYVGPTRGLFVEEGTPYLQSLHIKHGDIDFARRPYYVSPAWAAERPRIRLGFEDILIVQTGAIGEVSIVGKEFVGASCHALLIARTDRGYLRPRFLWHAFRSHWGRHALLREQTGALHPHLEAGNVRFMKFPIPSLPTQDRIMADTEAITRDVRAIQAALGRRMSLQAERRQALITAAVTGQFDVSTASGRNVTEGVSA
ncbi:restriction endonuclease subunit S [Streptomyces sp. NPDC014684]|uniref:restriction endonuclease subunit S n=1 Tax=Streptomyces sp. NPDC014684 TaxID=3364880 RepID=UPI003702984F